MKYESYKEKKDDDICEYSPCEELLDSNSYEFIDGKVGNVFCRYRRPITSNIYNPHYIIKYYRDSIVLQLNTKSFVKIILGATQRSFKV